jgi:hypothetical protein
MLSAHEAVARCRLLEQHCIRFWVMGGWGVDALLHRETRPHKDLDILLVLGDLPLLWKLLDEQASPCSMCGGRITGWRGSQIAGPRRSLRRTPRGESLMCTSSTSARMALSSSSTTIHGLSQMLLPGRGASPTLRSPVSPKRRNWLCTRATPCQMDSYGISNSYKGRLILFPSRLSSSTDLTRPPVKAGGRTDQCRLLLQHRTPPELHLFQVVDTGVMAIDQDSIGQEPQVLCGLQFPRMRRQEEKMHMLRYPQMRTGMPARAVQDQHNLFARTGTDGTSKGSQFGPKGHRELRWAQGSSAASLGHHLCAPSRPGRSRYDAILPARRGRSRSGCA